MPRYRPADQQDINVKHSFYQDGDDTLKPRQVITITCILIILVLTGILTDHPIFAAQHKYDSQLPMGLSLDEVHRIIDHIIYEGNFSGIFEMEYDVSHCPDKIRAWTGKIKVPFKQRKKREYNILPQATNTIYEFEVDEKVSCSANTLDIIKGKVRIKDFSGTLEYHNDVLFVCLSYKQQLDLSITQIYETGGKQDWAQKTDWYPMGPYFPLVSVLTEEHLVREGISLQQSMEQSPSPSQIRPYLIERYFFHLPFEKWERSQIAQSSVKKESSLGFNAKNNGILTFNQLIKITWLTGEEEGRQLCKYYYETNDNSLPFWINYSTKPPQVLVEGEIFYSFMISTGQEICIQEKSKHEKIRWNGQILGEKSPVLRLYCPQGLKHTFVDIPFRNRGNLIIEGTHENIDNWEWETSDRFVEDYVKEEFTVHLDK